MPVLDNAKHERFAQELAKGKTADEAYKEAGLCPVPFDRPSGAYVYLLISPDDGRVFYVGKGRGKRALKHQKAERGGTEANALKAEVLGRLRRNGQQPLVHILAGDLTDEQALRIERLLIVKAHAALTNIALGSRSLSERVRAEAREGVASLKTLCQLRKEGASRERLRVWADVVGGLSRIASAAPGL